MTAKKESKGCGKSRHCAEWGFCRKCQPEAAAKIEKEWAGMKVPEEDRDWQFEKIVRKYLG